MVGLWRNRKRQVFQGIAALLRCCQLLSRHTYNSNGKMNLLFPYFPWFVRCKRGVNCMRDGQKCLILQGKSAFVRGFAVANKKYLSQMQSASWKAVFSTRDAFGVPRFAAICQASLCLFSGVTMSWLKPKCGKMRQDEVINGSQMVVKIGVFYYRRGKKIMRENSESIVAEY